MEGTEKEKIGISVGRQGWWMEGAGVGRKEQKEKKEGKIGVSVAKKESWIKKIEMKLEKQKSQERIYKDGRGKGDGVMENIT